MGSVVQTSRRSEPADDLLVVGAGAVGLWIARFALEAGLRVRVLDRGDVGAGASGGVLGALMAHAPEPWTEVKQFQLDALMSLPGLAASLEQETGKPVGYGRIGRLTPIRNADFRAEAARRAAAAERIWGAIDAAFVLVPRPAEAVEAAIPPGWLAPDAAPEGAVWDSLAARLDPRRYVDALAASIAAHPRGRIETGAEVVDWAEGAAEGASGGAAEGAAGGAAVLADGARLPAAALAIAAGAESFALASRLGGAPLEGRGVKGQAAVYDIRPPEGAPMLYDRGVYVVPHADGRIAVGSTSQNAWEGRADAPDPTMRAYLERAAALCPLLRGARPIREWAGVRPRSAAGQPVVGRLPGARPLWIASGGYKIGLALAHAMARALIDRLVAAERPLPLPAAFGPQSACDNAAADSPHLRR